MKIPQNEVIKFLIKNLKQIKMSHLTIVSAFVSSSILIDYLSFIGLEIDIQNGLNMASVFPMLALLILFIFLMLILSFSGPYVLGFLNTQEKNETRNHEKTEEKTGENIEEKRLRYLIFNLLFWPFFWLFWMIFSRLNTENLYERGIFYIWLLLGVGRIICDYYVRKRLDITIPIAVCLIIYALYNSILSDVLPVWLFITFLWAAYGVYALNKTNLIGSDLIGNKDKIIDNLSIVLMSVCLTYLIPFVIHTKVAFSWTSKDIYQYILLGVFVILFIANLCFASIFLRNKFIKKHNDSNQSLLMPIYTCLVCGTLVFVISIILSDSFSTMLLRKVGIVQDSEAATWYAITNQEKLNNLTAKIEQYDWTDGYQSRPEEKFLWGYLALSMGNIRLLCPRQLSFRENMANDCLYLDKSDLQLIGTISNQCTTKNKIVEKIKFK